MAHEISEFTRPVAPGGDFPYGDIKDTSPGDPGTLVNRLMLTDIIQLMQRAMALGLITPNGDDDNDANGYQLSQALGLEEWTDAGTPTATAVGGGSITIAPGDVEYNRYKIVGRTLIWQMKLVSVTVSSTVSSVYFEPPAAIAATDLDFVNNGFRFVGFLNGQPSLIVALGGPTNNGQITMYATGGGNLPTGTDDQSYDIHIEAELFDNP